MLYRKVTWTKSGKFKCGAETSGFRLLKNSRSTPQKKPCQDCESDMVKYVFINDLALFNRSEPSATIIPRTVAEIMYVGVSVVGLEGCWQ